jgi:hypothetical protein
MYNLLTYETSSNFLSSSLSLRGAKRRSNRCFCHCEPERLSVQARNLLFYGMYHNPSAKTKRLAFANTVRKTLVCEPRLPRLPYGRLAMTIPLSLRGAKRRSNLFFIVLKRDCYGFPSGSLSFSKSHILLNYSDYRILTIYFLRSKY